MGAGTWFGMYQAIWDRITAMYPEGLGNRPKPCPHDPFGNDADTPDSMSLHHWNHHGGREIHQKDSNQSRDTYIRQ